MVAPETSPKSGTPEQNPFEDLLVEALGILEDGGSAALEQLLERQPAHATNLRQRIAELGRLGLIDTAAAREGTRAERMGDFRLITELGCGGMGVVYEAEQVSLGRRVALKLIRPELLWFGGNKARFRREIESVARLSHPGIVPIYTVGEEKGVPFFAMELIDGCTLSQVIAHLADKSPAKLRGADFLAAVAHCARVTAEGADNSTAPGLSPEASWNDVTIRIMRQVAEALEHAHSRGVVHRDVKPSNIVLTRTGRAMLIDFGLASKEGGERLTRSGSAGGSVAYMSPEQVRGSEVDARTDVYSLGVSFAEMLTLRQLFSGASIDILWRAILEGSFERPRQRVPTIPWDVETVCTTAMETDRERRYASAGEFANDLSNLLAHRPIEARRVGWMLRGLRWAQRHPRISAALLVAVVLGLAGSLVYARQQLVLGEQIREQRDVARDRAKELRELATTFVFDVHEKIKRLPGSTEAREQIVTQMQRLFDTLSKVEGDDPTLAHDLAYADLALGTMLEKTAGGTLGQVSSSGEHLEHAWKYFDLHARAPDASLADRRLLVHVQRVFGNYLTNNKQPERGLEVLKRGMEDAQTLVALSASTLEDSVSIAWFDLELGSTEARLGHTTQARELYSSAVDLLVSMEREHPEVALVLRPLSRAYLLLADSCEDSGDPVRAAKLFEAGIQAAERLLAIEPVPPINRRNRADCVAGLAGTQVRLSDPVAAKRSFERALREYEELRRADPTETQCTLDIARNHAGLSEALVAAGENPAALLAAREALRELDSLPPNAQSREASRRRLSVLQSIAEIETNLNELDGARAHLEAAHELARALLTEDPSDLFIVGAAAQILRSWADLEYEAGEHARSLELHRECIAAYERWLALAPQYVLAGTEESFERTLFAKALAANGEDEECLREFKSACEHAIARMGPEFKDPTMLERGAFTLLTASGGLSEAGRVEESEAWVKQGIEWCERILQIEPKRAMTRIYLLDGWRQAAERAAGAGSPAESLAIQRRALERRAGWAREADANPLDAISLAKELLEQAPADLRDTGLAVELCRLATERAKEQPAARYWLAKALLANGETAQALIAARETLAMIPTPVVASNEKLVKRLGELIAQLEGQ